jgi:signal peptidase I
MFGFFTPRYINAGRDLLKSAHKLLSYKKDLWSEVTVTDFETQMKKLSSAISARDEKAVEETSDHLDKLAGQFSPPPKDAGVRENCEVLLVAIIIALGVRTYFLQPFTIPTGSMQPTLNGIIGHPTKEEPPNLLTRAAQEGIFGRGYINVVCKADGEISNLQEFQRYRFFTYTQFDCGGVTYTVNAPLATLLSYFQVDTMRKYRKGDVIARGYIDTGDHVFVDKFTYNFRAPRRGEVFVFNTMGIPTYENRSHPEANSQFYIKRVGGLPGDELRIDPPVLYQNGVKATAFGYERVMSAINGYRGYSNTAEYGPGDYRPMTYLTNPQSTFNVPQKYYFALGDNSFHSSDSRDWGTVPQRNIVGKGLFVYWPFTSHWGLIK